MPLIIFALQAINIAWWCQPPTECRLVCPSTQTEPVKKGTVLLVLLFSHLFLRTVIILAGNFQSNFGGSATGPTRHFFLLVRERGARDIVEDRRRLLGLLISISLRRDDEVNQTTASHRLNNLIDLDPS